LQSAVYFLQVLSQIFLFLQNLKEGKKCPLYIKYAKKKL